MRTGTPAQKDHAMSTETWGRTCRVRGGREVARERGGREVTRGSLRARPYQHARVHALAHTHTVVFSTLPSHIPPPSLTHAHTHTHAPTHPRTHIHTHTPCHAKQQRARAQDGCSRWKNCRKTRPSTAQGRTRIPGTLGSRAPPV